MKKTLILLVTLAVISALLCACDGANVVPTLPMETITPTPHNQPSAMPTLMPTMPEVSMPVNETQPATSTTAGSTMG